MKNKVIVSIIVPCYNQAEYLSETLQSVLDQTFTDWECIIVDDGSPDNVAHIAELWCDKDPRFVFFHKENTGVSDTRNFAIRKSKGEYILPLDGDDLIDTHYIEEALKVFERQSNVKLVYSNLVLFGDTNKQLLLPDFSYEKMFVENQIFCSAIYRKADYDKTQGYNTNMKRGLEDWDFWLSFLKKDDLVVKLDGFFFFYRIKDVSRATVAKSVNEELILQIFKNHTDLYLQYFNPIRDHINADYYKQITDKLKKSAEYRIGKIVCYPFNLLKRVIKKLFR